MENGFYIPGATLSALESLMRRVVREEIKEVFPPANFIEDKLEIITRQTAANILGVSLNTLNDWTKRGIVQSYRVGTRIRYNKTEILNSLKKVEVPNKKR